ncbi:hypothetical protein [Rhodanobacter denitrificans]|uniref:hypothetical protein n=1 Tax=Rhodanobacter denitrificans TaxID=666685 RepID=UPI0009218D1A|nr:hypothetical protein [Rhodanobacter denitrificans]UJJ53115.1 hypothetical protein LRK52_18590 [Rhodanobacter denitrificans]
MPSNHARRSPPPTPHLSIGGKSYLIGRTAFTRAVQAGSRSLQNAPDGYAQRMKRGVRLHGADGEPFAFVVLDRSSQWLVTASRRGSQCWYMFALCGADARRLGLDPDSETFFREEHELASDIRRQLAGIDAAPPVRAGVDIAARAAVAVPRELTTCANA